MFETLNESPMTLWLNGWLWGFPVAEIFHIVMTGGFFGGILLLDLRLLGFHRVVSVNALMRHVVPSLLWLFGGVVVSGALLFMFMPLEYSGNPPFLLKLALIPAGGLNALFMHMVLMRNQFVWDVHNPVLMRNQFVWDVHNPVPAGVKLSALLSLAIWCSTLACGRLIAYYYGF